MALPAGSWKIEGVDHPTITASKNGGADSKGIPPKAIFVKLSEELLQQLKAASSSGTAPISLPFHLELATSSASSGSSSSSSIKGSSSSSSSNHASGSKAASSAQQAKPVSINLADKSYPLEDVLSTSLSSSSSTTKLSKASSKNSKVPVKTSSLLAETTSSQNSNASHSDTSTTSLKLVASNCLLHYQVDGVRHNNNAPRTAANMGERIRERNQQLEKEKESRKIVLVEDDGFASSTSAKGKKKGATGKAGKAASALLRPSTIPAKRAASPAGLTPRQSPLLGPTASRPPSRLIANEAAKGLMKKHQQISGSSLKPVSSDGKNAISNTEGISSPALSITGSRESTPVPVAQLPQHIQQQNTNSPSSLAASASKAPPAIDAVTANKSAKVAPPIQGSPARRQYHQRQLDEDDLASASSSSEDDEATVPLAMLAASPLKTHFSPEQLSKAAVAPNAVAPPASLVPVPAGPRSGSSSSSVSISSRKTPSPEPGSSAATSLQQQQHNRQLQQQRNSASLASTSTAAAQTQGASPKVAQINTLSSVKALSPDHALASSRESSPAPARAGATGAGGGPRTVAKTSGGSRLSRPIQKKPSPRVSPGPSPAVPPGPSRLSQSVSPPHLPEVVAGTGLTTAAVEEKSAKLAEITSAPPDSSSQNAATNNLDVSPSVALSPALPAQTAPTIPTTSISRPASPSPPDSQFQSSLSTKSNVLSPESSRPTSRAPSPVPHALPPKPAPSPSRHPYAQAHDRSRPTSRQGTPNPPSNTTAPSTSSTSSKATSMLLPPSLPVNPITGITPNIPKSPNVLPSKPPSSGSQHNKTPNGKNGRPPTSTSTGNSPIVSHFPPSASKSAPKSPNARPLSTSTPAGKRKEDDKDEGKDTVVDSDKTATTLSNTKRRKLNDGTTSSKSTSAASESDEDAEGEEEEGEYKPSPPKEAARSSHDSLGGMRTTDYPASEDEGKRGRPDGIKSIQKSNTSSRAAVTDPTTATARNGSNADTRTSSKERNLSGSLNRTADKNGLPSFTKKGRMSELKGNGGREASLPRSQNASRANTPISYSNLDVDPPLASQSLSRSASAASSHAQISPPYRSSLKDDLRNFAISNDKEFAHYSTIFSDKLFPEYTQLYAKLEKLQEALARNAGGNDPHLSSSEMEEDEPAPRSYSPQKLGRMVEEVNERSKELEKIKQALWEYSEGRQHQRKKQRLQSGEDQSTATTLKASSGITKARTKLTA